MTWAKDWPLAAILLGAFALTGAGVWIARVPTEESPPRRRKDVTVFHDAERRVTCWISPGFGAQGSGISCLPDTAFAPSSSERCQP